MKYFDNAATSFPKPKAVVSEMLRCSEEYCGNPGRSGHRIALRAAETVFACRTAAANLFGMERTENVVFTANATEAIHIAVHALARPGSILISDIEHNAVYRTVSALGASYPVRIFRTETNDRNTLKNFIGAIRPDTRTAVISAASNLCSLKNPICEIGGVCRKRGIRLIVDASQAAGHEALNLSRIGADALCMPGHKGLYGPTGTGLLLFSDAWTQNRVSQLPQVISGGSGALSDSVNMPPNLPERYEAGTPNVIGIAGLLEGLNFLQNTGIEAIRQKEREITVYLIRQLENRPKITLYYPDAEKSGLILFNHADFDSEETARRLDEKGFCLRAGLHCCPLGHRKLGTIKSGAVRISPGYFNSVGDATALASAICSL